LQYRYTKDTSNGRPFNSREAYIVAVCAGGTAVNPSKPSTQRIVTGIYSAEDALPTTFV